jgi:hypothetical protein
MLWTSSLGRRCRPRMPRTPGADRGRSVTERHKIAALTRQGWAIATLMREAGITKRQSGDRFRAQTVALLFATSGYL